MVKQIPLTQGQFAIVDDEDFERLNQHKWFARWSPLTQSFYAGRNSLTIDGKRSTISMHREVLQSPKETLVDHQNPALTLDNRRENLREANYHQNNCNKRKRVNNTSGYKGVVWHAQNERWRTSICIGAGVRLSLGLFPVDQKIEAARAYDRAAIQHHGEFARLNFPREDYA